MSQRINTPTLVTWKVFRFRCFTVTDNLFFIFLETVTRSQAPAELQ